MIKEIVLAGGCFWGVEEYYRRLKGVSKTEVGYAAGNTVNPTYQEVCSQTTNHAEVCKVTYDDTIITLEKILEHLFRIIDSTSLNKQGGDVGSQYRTGVYYLDKNDESTIKNYIMRQQQNYEKQIVVEVNALITMYSAEDYHQLYLVKNPTGYCHVNMSLIKKDELK